MEKAILSPNIYLHQLYTVRVETGQSLSTKFLIPNPSKFISYKNMIYINYKCFLHTLWIDFSVYVSFWVKQILYFKI